MTKPTPPALRVLIVDDDDGVQRLLTVIFEREGWIVLRAGHGGEALEMIRQHDPDVVLLDLMMPGVSGFDVLREIASTAPSMLRQILVVTAASTKLTGQAEEFGDVWRLVRKPFDIVELRAEVTQCALTRRRASTAAATPVQTTP